MKRTRSREWADILPWIVASLIWFGLVAPMRAEQENRLTEQSRVRRERVKSDRSKREAQALRTRVETALLKACGTSSDPAAVRQRIVAATKGLLLSPFNLSVNGGSGGGASVEAEGTRSEGLELLRRLGDLGRGGFLRTAALRSKGTRWNALATTGVLESFPGGFVPAPKACPDTPDPVPEEPETEKPQVRRQPSSRTSPPVIKRDVPVVPSPEPTPAPPFTLVAFLSTEGRNRVSIRVGNEIRVIAVGDQVDGWRCISIDRDDGAMFTSPTGEKVVLKTAQSSER